MGSKVSNLDIVEMTTPRPQNRLSNTRTYQTTHFVTQTNSTNKLSMTQPLPLQSLPTTRIVKSGEETSTTTTTPKRLNSIYYASIDNTSEMSSSDWDERNDFDLASDQNDEDNESDDDLFPSAPRKRSDSNCQNFVLIIDNLDSHLAEVDAQRSFGRATNNESSSSSNSSDVILNVLNISLQREIYTQKRFL